MSGSALAGLGLLDAGGSGEGVATGRVTLRFDGDMDPVGVELSQDVENTRLRGTGDGGALTADGSRSTGTATTRTWSMDVDEADRQAFLAAVPQLVGTAAPGAHGAAQALSDLGARIDRDAVVTRADWEVAATEERSGPALSVLVEGYDLSHTTTTQDRALESMTMKDLSQGSSRWEPVSSCG